MKNLIRIDKPMGTTLAMVGARVAPLLAATIAVLGLTACGPDTPDDKLTSDSLRPYAVAWLDGVKGIEVVDLERTNGWVDNNKENVYVVTYKYNLSLTAPLSEVMLAEAKAIEDELRQGKENSEFMGLTYVTKSMSANVEANKFVAAQNGKFAERRDAFIGACRTCIQYWNSEEGSKEATQDRRNSAIVAWSRLEALGFPDSAGIGQKVPRTMNGSFRKTEKGWAIIP